MQITQPRSEFLTMVDEIEEAGLEGYGYRLDTWQIWPWAGLGHPAGGIVSGLVVSLDDNYPSSPWALSWGPYVFLRTASLRVALAEIGAALIRLGSASVHLQALGYPCHASCDCDL